ncbi:MAG: hypothetical protein H6Q20_1467 [Bacteroidetes bacterium]|nr:hypothetical protein [Bacteroidota bacterium]
MNYLNKISIFLTIAGISFLVYSCANKAQGPTGGAKDVTPPKVLKSTPVNGALNFNKKQVQIFFDENISVEKVNDNVLISPPQKSQPIVKGNARVLTVSFEDNLIDSTTYTINFGNAIVDLNEKNPLKNYRFSFSTGNEIDTLQISGTLIDAENLNPMAGVLVGIYQATEKDSAFLQKPFLRIGKTDESGRFIIDNVKSGQYKVFALDDTSRDYFYQQGEGVAFLDSLVTPTFRREEMRDTIWKDSVTVDSIRTYMGTRFLPDNILLKYFKEAKKRQYFLKQERKQPQAFTLFFNAPLAELPVIKPLNFNWDDKYMLQKNNTMDTLTYWITESDVYNKDTLQMSMTYLKTDSVFRLVPQTDTLNVFMRKVNVGGKTKKGDKVPDLKAPFYKFNTNISGSFDVFSPIVFRFESPLKAADVSKIHLYQKIDSTLKALPVSWQQTDSTKMVYALNYKWEPEKTYEIAIDSTAYRDIYNNESDKFKAEFKIKSLDEYAAIKMLLAQYDSLMVLQVLDTKDNVLATKPAVQKGTLFEYLRPGDYFVRAFIDRNRNGVWDTGELISRRSPEEVYYYPKKLTLKANWEFEESWNINEIPLLQQKPAELKKDTAKKTGQ